MRARRRDPRQDVERVRRGRACRDDMQTPQARGAEEALARPGGAGDEDILLRLRPLARHELLDDGFSSPRAASQSTASSDTHGGRPPTVGAQADRLRYEDQQHATHSGCHGRARLWSRSPLRRCERGFPPALTCRGGARTCSRVGASLRCSPRSDGALHRRRGSPDSAPACRSSASASACRRD